MADNAECLKMPNFYIHLLHKPLASELPVKLDA